MAPQSKQITLAKQLPSEQGCPVGQHRCNDPPHAPGGVGTGTGGVGVGGVGVGGVGVGGVGVGGVGVGGVGVGGVGVGGVGVGGVGVGGVGVGGVGGGVTPGGTQRFAAEHVSSVSSHELPLQHCCPVAPQLTQIELAKQTPSLQSVPVVQHC